MLVSFANSSRSLLIHACLIGAVICLSATFTAARIYLCAITRDFQAINTAKRAAMGDRLEISILHKVIANRIHSAIPFRNA